MKIAVIGGGISGLVAAYQVAPIAEVTLFEANDYIGGHTHTIDVKTSEGTMAVDTGFIVFNDWTYPNFCTLLDSLDVKSQGSDMSFGFMSAQEGIAYALPRLSSYFASKSDLLKPERYRLLLDIKKFNTAALAFLNKMDLRSTLGEFCASNGLSRPFLHWYLYPMISSVWSADPKAVPDLPAHHFINFLKNHGLLSLFDRPQWRVVKGGSREYIKPLIASFKKGIRKSTPVKSILRYNDKVTVTPVNQAAEDFDHVIIGAHSDQTLHMLQDASEKEQEILGAIPYKTNDVVLHSDIGILPENTGAWASWNYRRHEAQGDTAQLTYYMNRLQNLPCKEQFCVSLNQTAYLDKSRVIGQYQYSHPAFGRASVIAQRRHYEISGINRTHFCGAYWGYGFHEDGVKSALAATAFFNRGTIA